MWSTGRVVCEHLVRTLVRHTRHPVRCPPVIFDHSTTRPLDADGGGHKRDITCHLSLCHTREAVQKLQRTHNTITPRDLAELDERGKLVPCLGLGPRSRTLPRRPIIPHRVFRYFDRRLAISYTGSISSISFVSPITSTRPLLESAPLPACKLARSYARTPLPPSSMPIAMAIPSLPTLAYWYLVHLLHLVHLV